MLTETQFSFRKQAMPLVINKLIVLYLIKEKGKSLSIHLVSNPEPLFFNISLVLLHYQVDLPNLRKV